MAVLASRDASAAQYSINIHGNPFSCTAHNGQLVPIFVDSQSAIAAAQLGGARADYVPGMGYRISLNTMMLSNTPPRAAILVFFHECGHVALPPGVGLSSPFSERNADCWAAEQMVLFGYIQNIEEFQEAATYLIQIGGLNSLTQQRIAAMQQCLF
ncbi:MAG: hypothetical protein GC184_01950 [Rhizobiales bacterium]|nr:hypothetical protein [Hyphomicrobiales bacterium]